MPTYNGPANRWMIASGYEIIGATAGEVLKDITPTELTATLEEVTGPADTRPNFRPTGFVTASDISYVAWYTDAALASNWVRVMRTDVGTGTIASIANRPALWGNDGEARGAACYGAIFLTSKLAMATPNAGLTTAAITHKITGGIDHGKLVCASGAQATGDTGDTKAAYYDNGAASTGGGAVYLEVTSLTLGGATDVIIKVEESVDFANWTDLVTFTAVTAAPAAQQVLLPVATWATLKRYVAVSWNFTGGGAGSGLSISVGMARY